MASSDNWREINNSDEIFFFLVGTKNSWSQCLNQSSRVRSAFSAATGEKGLRSHAIRWMAQFREAVQVYARFKIVKNIVSSAEVGCESLTNTLRAIIDAPAGGKTRPITVYLVACTKLDITHRNR